MPGDRPLLHSGAIRLPSRRMELDRYDIAPALRFTQFINSMTADSETLGTSSNRIVDRDDARHIHNAHQLSA